MKSFITNSSEETIALGKRLVAALPPSVHVVLLEGDLSAGKTTFTKGIALGLGIKDIVNSPTFTILKVYQGDRTLYHLDLYRLQEIGTDFDLEEYIEDENSFSVIEWPYRVSELLPNAYVVVKFTWLSESKRKIEILSHHIPDDWEDKL